MEEALIVLIGKLQAVLTDVKTNYIQDDFLQKPGKYLGPAIAIYADFLRQIKLSTFNDFLKKAQDDGRNNHSLQSVIEDLWELEETWDTFLKDAIGNKVLILIFDALLHNYIPINFTNLDKTNE